MTTGETVKKIDILINGRNYTINCPVDEQLALERASNYINNFIQEVRKHAPHLPHEEMLVLCALNLYESSEHLLALRDEHEQAQDMIDNMIDRLHALD